MQRFKEMRAKAIDMAANISQAVAAAGGPDPIDEFINAWRQIEYNLTSEDIAMGALLNSFPFFTFVCPCCKDASKHQLSPPQTGVARACAKACSE